MVTGISPENCKVGGGNCWTKSHFFRLYH